MERRRVVVTGMGAVTPLGTGIDSVWSGIMAARSTATRIDLFDPAEFAVRICCPVDGFDPLEAMDYRDVRRFDRLVQYAVASARQAVAHAGLDMAAEDPDQVGVLVGAGLGGLDTISAGCEALLTRGPMRVNPLTGAMMLPDMCAGQIAILLGARGPNFCVASACATGGTAIGEAAEVIRRGDADVMVAGSSEAGITPFGVAAFHRTGALSARNDDPKHASRPFDKLRDGFVFGEGAASLILEDLDHALARGARPLAELVGYGATADAFHVSAPRDDGSGMARAMAMALRKAGKVPADVHYINAHGTSTVLNDAAETKAIKLLFGDHAYRVPVSSTKSMHGHLMGAAGSVEAVITVLAIVNGVFPPTINYEVPDPACDLDYVPNTPRPAAEPIRLALSNSFGFGGHNATLALARYDADD
jgi:3-oxoacyl-[acyl-carrier-protein] synthase II